MIDIDIIYNIVKIMCVIDIMHFDMYRLINIGVDITISGNICAH